MQHTFNILQTSQLWYVHYIAIKLFYIYLYTCVRMCMCVEREGVERGGQNEKEGGRESERGKEVLF